MIKPLFNARLLAEARCGSLRVLDDEQRWIVSAWAADVAGNTHLDQVVQVPPHPASYFRCCNDCTAKRMPIALRMTVRLRSHGKIFYILFR